MTNTHLSGSAIQHELGRALGSAHIQQDVSGRLERAEVLRFEQVAGPVTHAGVTAHSICTNLLHVSE